jgi:hypothetical protein
MTRRECFDMIGQRVFIGTYNKDNFISGYYSEIRWVSNGVDSVRLDNGSDVSPESVFASEEDFIRSCLPVNSPNYISRPALKEMYVQSVNTYIKFFCEKQNDLLIGWLGGFGVLAQMRSDKIPFSAICFDIDSNQRVGLIFDWLKKHPEGGTQRLPYELYAHANR